MISRRGQKDYPAHTDIDESSLEPGSALAVMLGMVGERKRVLDLGCATGYLAKLLGKRQCDVVGIDKNAAAIEHARAFCTRALVADLDVTTLDEILGPDERFDVIVFGDVLEHLRNPISVLQRAHDVLEDGGFVVVSVPNIAHGAIRLALLGGHFDYQELGILDDSHLRFFTAKTIDELLLEAGFNVEAMQRTTLPVFEASPLVPAVAREDYDPRIVAEIERDTESDSLQFVIKAKPITGEARYRAMSRRYLQVNTELAHAKHALRARDQYIAELADAAHVREQELADARTFLADAETEMRRAQNGFNDLAPRVAAMASLEARATLLSNAAEQLASLQVTAHANALDLVRAQEQLIAARSERDGAVARLEEVRTELARAQAVIGDLTPRLAMRETLQERYRRAEIEHVKTSEQARTVERERDALAARVETLVREVTSLSQAQEQLAFVTQERDRALKRVADLQPEAGASTEQMRTLVARNAELEHAVKAATAEATAKRAELLVWLDKLESVTKALAQEQTVVATLERQLEEERSAAATRQSAYETDARDLRVHIDRLRASYEQARSAVLDERDQARGAVAIAEAALAQALADATSEREAFDAQVQASKAREATMQGDLERLRVSHMTITKTLEATSARFMAHINASMSQTHEEAQQIATLIDEIQASRFWGVKRVLRRLLGRDTPQ